MMMNRYAKMTLNLLLTRSSPLSEVDADLNDDMKALLKLEEDLLEATLYGQWEQLLTTCQYLELRSYELPFTQEQNQLILVSMKHHA